MSNDLRKPLTLVEETMIDLFSELYPSVEYHSHVAKTFDTKARIDSFARNRDLTTAQAILSANDSRPTMEVVYNQFSENKAMVDTTMATRVAKAEAGFDSVKSMITKDGRRRGYEVSGKVIRPNFGPNRYDMVG